MMNKFLKQAFTLIELLVVIAIIGILSGLIVVAMGGMTTKATIAKAQVFSNSLRNSLMLNLVSEWKFDGAATDAWGSNNGTWSGSGGGTNIAANYRPSSECVSGQCLNFDGTDDYVDFGTGSNLNIIDAITIGAWVKTSSVADVAICARGLTGSSDHTWNFLIGSAGQTIFYWANGYSFGVGDYVQGISYVNDNKWHYLVAEATGSKLNVYVDGLVNGTNSSKTTKPTSNASIKVTVGRILGYSTMWYSGLVDEVRIYNSAIPTSQIKENYYAGLNSLLINGAISKKEYLSRINDHASID